MSEQTGLISRIGNFFKRAPRPDGNFPLEHSSNGHHDHHNEHNDGIEQVGTTRTTFLRPWGNKRDSAVNAIQESFTQLTGLMSSIQENMEKQGHRQEELIGYLANLPQALQSLPESQKIQTETLRAITGQLEQQTQQQGRLTDILEKVGEAHVGQKDILDQLRERVDTLNVHDQAVSENLKSVGASMEEVSKSSHTSSQILSQMRDNTTARDGQLERILHKQNVRFTTMLAIAIFLSLAAVAAVCVIGYLVMYHGH